MLSSYQLESSGGVFPTLMFSSSLEKSKDKAGSLTRDGKERDFFGFWSGPS